MSWPIWPEISIEWNIDNHPVPFWKWNQGVWNFLGVRLYFIIIRTTLSNEMYHIDVLNSISSGEIFLTVKTCASDNK